jgi:hypothetical protein
LRDRRSLVARRLTVEMNWVSAREYHVEELGEQRQ